MPTKVSSPEAHFFDAGQQSNPQAKPQATIIASHGRHHVAQDQTQQHWQVFCKGKGKNQDLAVGDKVLIQPSAPQQAWVQAILPRKNLLYRSEAHRSKVFAANLDQALLVLAPSPPYSLELLGRAWVACQAAGIPLYILVNKLDAWNPGKPAAVDQVNNPALPVFKRLQEEIATLLGPSPMPAHHYILGISVHEQTHQEIQSQQPIAQQQAQALLSLLKHKHTLVFGQSGVGKSSLINWLIPSALAATNTISTALNSGKHTTTTTRLHQGENGMVLLDSPGFQSFGLHHINKAQLQTMFADIDDLAQGCQFNNCQHQHEPRCAVKEALNQGSLAASRFQFYQHMLHALGC